MALKVLRRSHQLRAERLEARDLSAVVSPLLLPANVASQGSTQDGNNLPVASSVSVTTADTNPKHPKAAPAQPSVVPIVPVPSFTAITLPDPVMTPTTTAAADTPSVLSTSVPVVVPPVALTASSSSSSLALASIVSSSSLSSSSSSSLLTTATTPAPVLVPTSSQSLVKTSTTFRNLPQDTFVPSQTISASPSVTSSAAHSSMSTGSIVGIAAASIAGVALLGVAGVWFLKRYFTNRDEDDGHPTFQRHSWMRNSVALPDDMPLPMPRGPSATPRPPSMVERKQTQNLANIGRGRYPQGQGGYPQDYGQGGYPQGQGGYPEGQGGYPQGQGGYPQGQGGYPQGHNGYPQDMGDMGYYQDAPYGASPMPNYNPNQHFVSGSPHNSAQPFFSPIASSPPPLASPGVASFDESMPPMQHASLDPTTGTMMYFSRRESNMSGPNGALDDMPNPHQGPGGYATLDRTSVTPYQAEQYAAISKQLSSPLHDSVIAESAVVAPTSTLEQSPFADPVSPSSAPPPPSSLAPGAPPVDQYQELTLPSPAHARIDSNPPMIPPMRAFSPVNGAGTAAGAAHHSSIIQIASAFPAAPTSPQNGTFPPAPVITTPSFPQPVAIPGYASPRSPGPRSPKSPSFKERPPLSPQIVSVPDGVHAGRETPVQFGFNEPAAVAAGAGGVNAIAQAQAEVDAEAKAAKRNSVSPTPNTNAKRMSVVSKKSNKSGRPETLYDEDDAYGGI